MSSCKAQMSNHSFLGPPRVTAAAFHGPRQRLAQGFTQDRSTGFADGRQLPVRPLLRLALPQLPHQQTGRPHHEVHVPGLALAVTQLTVSPAQLLLAIPMERFRACPTIPVRSHDAAHLPVDPIGRQDDSRRRIVSSLPQDDDTHLVLDIRDAQRAGEVPLLPVPFPQRLAHARVDTGCQRRGLEDAPLGLQLAVELERADVATRLAVA